MFSSSLSQYGYSYRFFNASFLFSLFSLPRNSCTAAGGRELWAASLNYRHKGVGVLAGKSQEQEPAVEGCSEWHWAVTNWLNLTVPQHQVVSLAVFSTWKLLCCGIRSLSRHRCSHNPPAGKERSQVGLFWFGTVGSAKEGCWGLLRFSLILSLQCLSRVLFFVPFRKNISKQNQECRLESAETVYSGSSCPGPHFSL